MLKYFFGLDGANRSLNRQVFYFCGRVGGGGVEKCRLKPTSAKVQVEVEAELGKNFWKQKHMKSYNKIVEGIFFNIYCTPNLC